MKQQLCLVAALAGGAMPAPALAQGQGQTTLYGNIDEYVGYIRSSSGASIIGLNDGAILRSRLGVRGGEDLGGGYQFKFTLEQGFATDSGVMADGSRLFDRQAWIGLAGPYGEWRIGRQNTEIFMAGGAIDYTERTTFGSLFNSFGIPSRYDNDLYYKSPRLQGAQLTLHYALPENAGRADNGPVVQAMLDWQGALWRAGYVGLAARPDGATATVRNRIVYHNVYVNYQYGKGKVYLALGRSNNNTASANGLNTAAILSNISSPNNYFAGTDLNAARYYNLAQVSADFMLGHIGDKYGRKKVLTFTLLLMGVSTFLVGLLPTYNQAGILSPIMLVVLRMLQGISAAGEQAGANSMTLEHAPPHRRAFFTSFTLSGTQAGLILATLVFLPISALPEEQLLSWGWRIPFFLSAMAIGTQIGFALGGFAPTISAAILRPNDPMGWVPVAAFVTCTSIISAFAVFTARETCRVPMQDLGKN